MNDGSFIAVRLTCLRVPRAMHRWRGKPAGDLSAALWLCVHRMHGTYGHTTRVPTMNSVCTDIYSTL